MAKILRGQVANWRNATTMRPETKPSEVMALPRWFKNSKPKPAVIHDFTNQLDLFSEASIDTPVPVVSEPAPSGEHHVRPRPPQQLGFGPLEPLPPFDAGAATEGTPAGGSAGGDDRAVQQLPVRPGVSPEAGISPGVGDGDKRIPHGRIILDEPDKPSRDFRITEAHRIGVGGAHEKAKANIEAIRLLKQLETEDRDASDPEKAILARYVGWGGIAGVFESNYRRRPEWDKPAEELRKLLTDDEYESARASTPNAHFTSPMVIGAIWDGLHRMGVGKDVQVLEPAIGVGNFFGLMPESMAGGHRTGIELDSITARIAKKLYPDSSIFAKGLEDTPLPDNYFDAVVGNVPFGDYAVHDPSMNRQLTRAIHDYFFAKSLEKTRPGGVMALITSRYTMDKRDESVRKYLAEKADLLGAIRLPNTAFKGNAGTEVTTDILFFGSGRRGKHLPDMRGNTPLRCKQRTVPPSSTNTS